MSSNDAAGVIRHEALPERGTVLPAVALTNAATGAPVSLRSGRGPRVLLVPHDADRAGCIAWVNALVADGRAIGDWGARVGLVLQHDAGAVTELRDALPDAVQLLSDPRNLLQLPPASLIVLDEWGEVYFAMRFDAEHPLPDPGEVAEWSRFIAIQCPECEQAEGAWRTV